MSDSDQVKIARLQENMKSIEKKVDDGFKDVLQRIQTMSDSIDKFHDHADQTYATKEDIVGTRKDVEVIRKIATIRTFWAGVSAFLVSTIVTSLIYFFFTHQ